MTTYQTSPDRLATVTCGDGIERIVMHQSFDRYHLYDGEEAPLVVIIEECPCGMGIMRCPITGKDMHPDSSTPCTSRCPNCGDVMIDFLGSVGCVHCYLDDQKASLECSACDSLDGNLSFCQDHANRRDR